MSTILVIQPYKMLQQAFAVALVPDYQVCVQEIIPESSAVKDFDAVIVDAASLVEHSAGAELRAVRSWKVPTIWIDNNGVPNAPTRENLVIVKRPLHSDSLRKALLECLAASRSRARPAVATSSKSKDKGKPSAVADDKRQFIELVEVVEAPPLPDQNETVAKKK